MKRTMKRMAKYIAALLTLILTTAVFSGCFFMGNAVLDHTETYSVSTEVKNLYIEINAAELYIEEGEAFAVESNLKNLDVDENGGRLTIKDLTRPNPFVATSRVGAELTIYIPSGMVFESVFLAAGAGGVEISSLSSEKIEFKLGAGEVSIGELCVKKSADIDGGAGRITVSNGTISNLDIDMGVGELKLTAELLGDCELDMGVGEADITLIGSMEDYKLELDKGIGSIFVDGKEASDFGSSGNGSCVIDIEGGIGNINIRFDEVKNSDT